MKAFDSRVANDLGRTVAFHALVSQISAQYVCNKLNRGRQLPPLSARAAHCKPCGAPCTCLGRFAVLLLTSSDVYCPTSAHTLKHNNVPWRLLSSQKDAGLPVVVPARHSYQLCRLWRPCLATFQAHAAQSTASGSSEFLINVRRPRGTCGKLHGYMVPRSFPKCVTHASAEACSSLTLPPP